MATSLSAAPVLSTPSEHVFEDPTPAARADPSLQRSANSSIRDTYEVSRSAAEVVAGGWARIGLQFPDHMLCDAPAVVQELEAEIATLRSQKQDNGDKSETHKQPRIYVLADTSYSACCVDEIAAEHVNAEVVIHYGRSCLSPTSRLPVIYVFTRYLLNLDNAVAAFEAVFPEKDSKVVMTADVMFQDHVAPLTALLRTRGYTTLLETVVVHEPTATIPNRSIITDEASEPCGLDAETLKSYALFHISEPPTAVLLALVSRFRSLHVLPTATQATAQDPTYTTHMLLQRRFARVLSMATAGVIGILVNTLSVSNYMASVDVLRKRIAAAGKKSYTIVVGKLNPAKLANFSEIEGWVVVGCWESGLVEDDRAFYVPVLTPFEMGVALMSEEERVWGMEWWGGLEGLKLEAPEESEAKPISGTKDREHVEIDEGVDDDESAPPEFDLRTGRYVSTSRPMRMVAASEVSMAETTGGQDVRSSEGEGTETTTQKSLISRGTGDLAMVNGVLSPGAEYLRSKRTWQGLGSDFTDETSTVVEQGLRGVARGYVIGDEVDKV
ncbi:Diphthamide biosynthesis protein 2 [Ceratocystis fimbriata CBS 114723]|uniref:2-(3-amino-3-carboxypropyl)histidine synthase subunit 2 n=1 Tax=Ceratocystis fimbriata CBS 114723 TaxID=1035309 RepID=A0A2C5X469_9PEZI|nr:Diphthamide biosynthesis protein 2 [Ceratocystis fimbriata CBS 114723]